MTEKHQNFDLSTHGSTWLRADFHLHTKADKEFMYSNAYLKSGIHPWVSFSLSGRISSNILFKQVTHWVTCLKKSTRIGHAKLPEEFDCFLEKQRTRLNIKIKPTQILFQFFPVFTCQRRAAFRPFSPFDNTCGKHQTGEFFAFSTVGFRQQF